VSRYLKTLGVERLAVATVEEAKDLRRAGIPGPVHVLGSMPEEDAADVVDFDVIPSISTIRSVKRLSDVVKHRGLEVPFKACVLSAVYVCDC
jgi:alanine racemase